MTRIMLGSRVHSDLERLLDKDWEISLSKLGDERYNLFMLTDFADTTITKSFNGKTLVECTEQAVAVLDNP